MRGSPSSWRAKHTAALPCSQRPGALGPVRAWQGSARQSQGFLVERDETVAA